MPNPEPSNNLAIRLESITKRFGGIVANDDVSVDVAAGSWHAIVGENGAGKSTLLSVLYGVYRPDSGRIVVDSADVTRSLRSPADAIRLGIGLVTQHYSLVHGLTVVENIVLGQEPTAVGGRIDWRLARERAARHAEPLGLSKNLLDSPIETLSPAAQQKIEIAKTLFRGARVLLLDEPTATLAPHEAQSLLSTLHDLKTSGTTIIVVTHKLQEVFDHSDDVTVLRLGKCAGTFRTADIDRDKVFRLMIGETTTPTTESGNRLTSPVPPELGVRGPGFVAIKLSNVSPVRTRGSMTVAGADFAVRAGEIVGFAGVDGSGQTELAEAIVGLRPVAEGEIEVDGRRLNGMSIHERRAAGVSYIPTDRNREGLIPAFTIEQNLMLGRELDPAWGGGWLLRPQRLREAATALIDEWDVRGADRGGRTPAASLSGGNQQKVLVGRSMAGDPSLSPSPSPLQGKGSRNPKVLVACQPTRGLDIRAAQMVYDRLRRAASNGLAVLLFSLDLDEVMDLSDRVIVMFNGALSPPLARGQASRDAIGRLMTGLVPLREAHVDEDVPA